MNSRDFIKYVKKNLPKQMDIDAGLVKKELEILDLAKRVSNYESRKTEFEVSLEEARLISGTQEDASYNIPFQVPEKLRNLFRN